MVREVFVPYPYQQEAVETSLAWRRQGLLRFVLELPTGAGKTLITGKLLRALRDEEGETRPLLVIVPRLDLVSQTWKKFVTYFFDAWEIGLVQSEHNLLGRPITLASIDTLAQPARLAALQRSWGGQSCGAIVCDECHMETLGESYERVLSTLAAPDTLVVGLSATPYRGDNRSIARVFPDGVVPLDGLDWISLVMAGYLADIESIDVPTGLDLSNLTNPEEEANAQAYGCAMLFETWLHVAQGKRTIVFAGSKKAAYQWRDFLAEKGYGERTEVVVDTTRDRDTIYDRMRRGELLFLVTFRVLRTGLDIPEIECGIIDAVMNRGDFTQAVGRLLRLCAWIGKIKAILINGSDVNHQLMSVGKLLGTYSDVISSVRRTALEQLEKEEKEDTEEDDDDPPVERKASTREQVLLALKQVRARSRDLFVAEGWTQSPTTGLLCKLERTSGTRVEAEPVLAGGYSVWSISRGGQRRQLTPGIVDARQARRLGERYLAQAAREQEKRAAPIGSHPDHALPLTEKQWGHLHQRGVTGVPRTYEEAQEVVTQGHYLVMEKWMSKDEHGAAFDRRTRQFISFDMQARQVRVRSAGPAVAVATSKKKKTMKGGEH